YLLADKQPLKTERVNAKDLIIHLPAMAPDTVNSVIVLEMKDIKTDSVRLPDIKDIANVMRAFDGALHGSGLQYGDGKLAAYYVHGWKRGDQYISWKVRLTTAARFNVGIKYAADASSGGSYEIRIGDKVIAGKVIAEEKKQHIVSQQLDTVSLPAGEYELTAKPVQITGTELMKLFEITMQPIPDHL
ncbi:MAG TPA: hypothetical protein VM802_00940, partial [Chitinophaga sp.]|nr:hypothetical protein [Chitinophaga sp.]